MEISNSHYIQKLVWHVVYDDGTTLHQHDGATAHSSESIDRRRLRQFILTTTDGKIIIRQHFKPGQKLIYRTRNALKPGKGQIDRLHILGWEHNDIRHVAFIHENSLLVEMGDFVNDSPEFPWYYQYEKLPHDDIEVQ